MATDTKEIGIIGLGSMGGNIARVLHSKGYSLALYDKTRDKYPAFESMKNVYLANDNKDLVRKLTSSGGSATVWIMLPGGDITNAAVSELSSLMRNNDIVIDGSNSLFEDSISNYEKLKDKGISYIDVGCAGGPEDLLTGVSLYVGGDRSAFERTENIFKALSGNQTYGYVGASGSGQKVKLVHNMIFYGIFPVYAEGAAFLLKIKETDPNLDVNESLRLLASSPPINRDVMDAIYRAYKENKLPADAPQIKISEMVLQGSRKAESMGIRLNVINAVLDGYKSMSEETRRIYTAAKRIVTGH